MVAGGVVELLVDATGEDERRERMEVRQQNYRVDDLCQRPAIRTFRQFLQIETQNRFTNYLIRESTFAPSDSIFQEKRLIGTDKSIIYTAAR